MSSNPPDIFFFLLLFLIGTATKRFTNSEHATVRQVEKYTWMHLGRVSDVSQAHQGLRSDNIMPLTQVTQLGLTPTLTRLISQRYPQSVTLV